jgi:hypothetical protein
MTVTDRERAARRPAGSAAAGVAGRGGDDSLGPRFIMEAIGEGFQAVAEL